MLFGMSKPMLESFVAAADMLVRIFAILAAISAIVYLVSSRQLQKASAPATEKQVEPEGQHAQTQAEIQKAQRTIEELKKENAQLATQFEEEHEARLIIQRRLGPRHVSPKANLAIIATLQPFAGQKLNFGYFADVETAAFAEQLLDAVKAAGWKPQVFKLKNIQPIYGVECGGPNPQEPALQALTQALQFVDKEAAAEGSGTSIMGQALQPQLTDQLWVMVGLKRPHLRKAPQANGDTEPKQGDGAVDRD
jgi:hypothetical protein